MIGPRKAYKTIDEYIESFPPETQVILEKIRQLIRKRAPKAEEVISYGIPAFKLNGKYLIYFAGYKTHIGIYPIRKSNKELEPYLSGKATARFPLTKPFPFDLVEKIVLAKLEDNKEII